MVMHEREAEQLKSLSSQFKAVAVVGPRAVGKTTLVRSVFKDMAYSNLDNRTVLKQARRDPRGYLAQFPNGAIIDEAQNAPELFSYLLQILDESRETGQFILVGSVNFLLDESITQSLAGRIAYLHLRPLALSVLTEEHILSDNEFAYRGGYPEIWSEKVNPSNWFQLYLSDYLQIDVGRFDTVSDKDSFYRFLLACAERVDMVFDASEIANKAKVELDLVLQWLTILEATFIAYRKVVETSNNSSHWKDRIRLYFFDTGLLCCVLGIRSVDELVQHSMRANIINNLNEVVEQE